MEEGSVCGKGGLRKELQEWDRMFQRGVGSTSCDVWSASTSTVTCAWVKEQIERRVRDNPKLKCIRVQLK